MEVKVKIISRVYDLRASDYMETYIEAHPDGKEDERIEASVHGTLTEEDGQICLTYCEPVEQGLDQTVTRISFSADDPETVTLCREGGVRHQFVFGQTLPRRTYLYETNVMAIEMSISTKKLLNRLHANGGTLHLDYKIDVHGSGLSRTIIDLMVREVRK